MNYKSVNNEKPREIACAVLARAEAKEVHLDLLLGDALPRLTGPDRALCQELVYGVCRWRLLLDWIISNKTDGRAQKPGLQNLLRVGVYQLFWLDRVPDHAIVNESVELTRKLGLGGQSGFVNALLRNCIRDRDSLKAELKRLKETEPSVGWSHPAWLVERWMSRWSENEVRSLLEWNNKPAEVYLRVNTIKIDPGRLVERWRLDERVEYDFVRLEWVGENQVFKLRKGSNFTNLPSFKEGCFYVQDPSTLLAVKWLDPQPGERILDLCAAPGGKATAIAAKVDNQALIVARDNSEARLKLLQQNCTRLGVNCIEPELLTPDQTGGAGGLRFDRALVDAPCSNTGVLRRRVEARWRLQPDQMKQLTEMQRELLEQAAAPLNSGGTLIYSTCSLEPEENEDVVNAFIADHPDFTLVRERQLLPFRDGVDGAYVAHLRKRPDWSV
ncbi:MAG: 16S rRNA (cytosine(967)-C(5))-methyltransferase RsmB [Limisphaerales bacterium]